MPGKTILEIPADEQEQMLTELRQARFGHLLSLHILLLCAHGHTPSEMAAFLFCARSSVDRTVNAYRRGTLDAVPTPARDGSDEGHRRPSMSSLTRSLVAIIKRVPSAFGWCRTRWSCQTLALELRVRRGVKVSRETIRRWLHEQGYVWKRARHVARDSDPERVTKLARIRHLTEIWAHLRCCCSSINWTSTGCPRSAMSGCCEARRPK